ncbi:MAG: type II toxin-antitoxin system HicB family antitoxin [Gammaproteobacteria bacterium]|nr:type II toxin-antitoxin system HicB family antitoxin [Gammaproteobacteria bacterium]
MTTITHGNYVATIEFDPEIELFFGNVINLGSPVTFYGGSIDELKSEFEKSIRTYLEVCKEKGIPPEEPYSGHFDIHVTPKQHSHFAQVAAMQGKKLNAWAAETLEKATH